MPLKLGKTEHTEDKRDLLLGTYVDLANVLPHIPVTFGHETGLDYPMDGNGPDESVAPGFEGAGDCVFAGAGHETQVWRKAAGLAPAAITGKSSIKDYSAVTGYVVGDDSTDQGTNVRDALKYRVKSGIHDDKGGRHKITAYLALDPGNVDHLYAAMYLFGAVGIGIQFPQSAMDQFNRGKSWTPVKGSPIEGGHYIPLVARRQALRCVTWAKLQYMTIAFFREYCDEAWAILSPEAINSATKKSPEGFDLATLKKDLAAL